MSTTPRTQAATKTYIWNGVKHIFVDATVCEQIESELAAALQLQSELQSALKWAKEQATELREELNDCKEIIESQHRLMRNAEQRGIDKAKEELAAVAAERDALKQSLARHACGNPHCICAKCCREEDDAELSELPRLGGDQ